MNIAKFYVLYRTRQVATLEKSRRSGDFIVNFEQVNVSWEVAQIPSDFSLQSCFKVAYYFFAQ